MLDPDFLARARKQLTPILGCSGKILYSAADTLVRGDLYVLGLNPGGDPIDKGHWTVGEALRRLPEKRTNDYLDESWRNAPPGTRPLQQRLRWLVAQLGYELRSVCASNLIFARSRRAAGSRYPELARICWPVHEQILALVQPKMLLVFGNSSMSPFHFLRELAGRPPLELFPSEHGAWSCKAFTGHLAGERRVVIGLPHLSRFKIVGKSSVAEWIARFLRT